MKKLLFLALLFIGCTPQQEEKAPVNNNTSQPTVIKQEAPATQLADIHSQNLSMNKFENTSVETHIDNQEEALPKDINYQPKGNYSRLKSTIKAKQAQYQAQASDSISVETLDKARTEITNYILQEIMPFWYGTEWDFNGYTAIPGKGEIACGYLVSTTLRDVGFKLNRYHLAQQNGLYAALSLQKKDEIITLRGLTSTALKEKMIGQLKAKAGLYFVGLDNHVGYILIHNEDMYFIHSDYISDKVRIEPAETSMAFNSSIYVIADITHNDELISKWIKGETIPIKRG